jgi:hypothetical protein
MTLPQKVELPFFAYGAFMPGELAFEQVRGFLDSDPVRAYAPGLLKVRDGLPLLDPGGSAGVQGFLLTFRVDVAVEGYKTICAFEPKSIYFWAETTLQTPKTKANVLHGKSVKVGGASILEENRWSFRMDPVFGFGLAAVQEIVDEFGYIAFPTGPPDSMDWSRFFKLQMAYLLLWSAIERFSALAYGPSANPMQKLRALSEDPRFSVALRRHVSRTFQITDSRDLEQKSLNVELPVESAEFYYQVRNNLSHRGKGAYLEADNVRESLLELSAIFKDILVETEKQKSTSL